MKWNKKLALVKFYYHKKPTGFSLMKVSRKLISSSIKYIIYSIKIKKKKNLLSEMSGLFKHDRKKILV